MNEYFTFVQIGEDGKKPFRYDLISAKGDFLGIVQYYPAWRQYCFFPEDETVWSAGCLKNVMEFLGKINGNKGT